MFSACLKELPNHQRLSQIDSEDPPPKKLLATQASPKMDQMAAPTLRTSKETTVDALTECQLEIAYKTGIEYQQRTPLI